MREKAGGVRSYFAIGKTQIKMCPNKSVYLMSVMRAKLLKTWIRTFKTCWMQTKGNPVVACVTRTLTTPDNGDTAFNT